MTGDARGKLSAGVRAVAIATALALVIAPITRAQGRYRLAIGVAGEPTPLVAEFRVCVPAETSDCGSWLVRTADADDPPVSTPRAAIQQLRSPNGADSVSIEGDAVVIRSLTPGATPARSTIRETALMARTIAMTPDSRYVFVVFEGARADSSVIDMVELRSMAVIDALPIRGRAAGIAVLR